MPSPPAGGDLAQEGNEGSHVRDSVLLEPLPLEDATLVIPRRTPSPGEQVHSAPGRLEIPQIEGQSPNQPPSTKSPQSDSRSNLYEGIPRSSLPIDESAIMMESRNEQRYRMLLQHEFECSCKSS